jgi:hypothetical protein
MTIAIFQINSWMLVENTDTASILSLINVYREPLAASIQTNFFTEWLINTFAIIS